MNLPKFLIARDPRNNPHITIVIHTESPVLHARILNNGDLEAVYTDPITQPDEIARILKLMAKWYYDYRRWEIEQSVKRHAHEGDVVNVCGVEFVESGSLYLIKCIQEDLGGYIHSYNSRWRLMLISEDYKTANWINANKRFSKLSDELEAPDPEELDILTPGNLVKVCAKKEYLTIVVTSITDKRVLGVVQSNPKKTVLHGISNGDRVSFKKYHIFEIKRLPI